MVQACDSSVLQCEPEELKLTSIFGYTEFQASLGDIGIPQEDSSGPRGLI